MDEIKKRIGIIIKLFEKIKEEKLGTENELRLILNDMKRISNILEATIRN